MRPAALLLIGLATACAPAADSNAQGKPDPSGAGESVAALKLAPALPVGAPRLSLPIACRMGETCALQNHVDRDPGPEAKDYRCGHHTYQAHGGVDIRLPDMMAQRAGVDVLAAAPGRVSRLRDGVADISVKTAGVDAVAGINCGNAVVIDHGGGWETQYCHLAKGSVRVKEGEQVIAGEPIGKVGLSGMTEYPHLHLTVRSGSAIIDPFAPTGADGACDPRPTPDRGMWDEAAAKALSYNRGVVLNAGFSAGPASMEAVEAGGIERPSATSPALVAYVRAINLEAGDVQELVIRRPDRSLLAQNTLAPLPRSQAQYAMYVGKPMPAGGWPIGTYTATYKVNRSGVVAIATTFEIRL